MNTFWNFFRFLTITSLVLSVSFGPLASSEPVFAAPLQPFQSLLYQDNFEDGNFTSPGGANGLTWTVFGGNASVDSVNGSLQLGVDRGNSLIVTNQRIPGNEYTVRFDGTVTWSAPGRVVVLFKDAANYYSVGLGSEPGIYRKMNGVEVQLNDDPESLVRLPHGSSETGAFKVYAHNTGQAVIVKADKAGDGVDYDIAINDTDPAAVAKFTNTAVGMLSTGTVADSPWFYIDNVAIYDGLVTDTYVPVTYYVDQSHPQASDANPGTESLPWKTIQKAADSIKAGDTVIVKSGSYPERITFSNGRRGAPGQVVTFKAQPRRTVTMWGFYTQFAHYLRIQGFNITTDASLTGWTEQNGVFISSDHVEVVDNYLYGLKGTAISGDSVGTIVSGNRIYQSQAGIVISGTGWLVEGNEVERLYHWSDGDSDYSRFFGDDHVIRGNYFHGTNFNEIADAHVDCFQTFDNNGEHAHHILFENNICTEFHQGLMGEAAYYHNTSDLTFRNNIFAHGLAWGLCVEEITNVTAVHNVFADIQYHGMGFRDGASGLVENNIFYNAGSNYWASDGGSVSGSHNLLYNTTDTIAQPDFPNDLVNRDPLFVNPGANDYHIREGSPAMDAGLNVGVTADLDGNPRPQGAGYDIGAYEFTPALVFWGVPGNNSIYLGWKVNYTLSPGTTWQIDYTGGPGTPPSPITGIAPATRSFSLSGLTNHQPYTITLIAMDGTAQPLSKTVVLAPTDQLIYMPLLMLEISP